MLAVTLPKMEHWVMHDLRRTAATGMAEIGIAPHAICREFRLSRKVVRKVIRSEATEFRYERGRQPLPRIDPWRAQLDGLLLANGSQ